MVSVRLYQAPQVFAHILDILLKSQIVLAQKRLDNLCPLVHDFNISFDTNLFFLSFVHFLLYEIVEPLQFNLCLHEKLVEDLLLNLEFKIVIFSRSIFNLLLTTSQVIC